MEHVMKMPALIHDLIFSINYNFYVHFVDRMHSELQLCHLLDRVLLPRCVRHAGERGRFAVPKFVGQCASDRDGLPFLEPGLMMRMVSSKCLSYWTWDYEVVQKCWM